MKANWSCQKTNMWLSALSSGLGKLTCTLQHNRDPHGRYFAPRDEFPALTIALGSLRHLIALPAVSLSVISATIIQTINDHMSQGVDIQFKILQTLLPLITNFPAIHGRLANVRAFVLRSLFSSLTDLSADMRHEIGPASLFQAT